MLQFYSGVDTFTPSPYLFLQTDADSFVKEGETSPLITRPFGATGPPSLDRLHVQCQRNIIRSSRVRKSVRLDGTPATSMSRLQDFSYDLPNIHVLPHNRDSRF
jgi:hypothetical protein